MNDNSKNMLLKKSPYVFMTKYNDETVIASNLSTGEVLQPTPTEAQMLTEGISDSEGQFEKSGFLVSLRRIRPQTDSIPPRSVEARKYPYSDDSGCQASRYVEC